MITKRRFRIVLDAFFDGFGLTGLFTRVRRPEDRRATSAATKMSFRTARLSRFSRSWAITLDSKPPNHG
jgi:hypothetical protein